MNRDAQALGRLAKGKPKTNSPEDIEAKKLRLIDARKVKAEKRNANITKSH